MNKNIVIYRRHASHESSPAPQFKSIIWIKGDKHPLPIAFYASTAEDAELKAQTWLDDKAAKNKALADRAATANAAKAAKKEKGK